MIREGGLEEEVEEESLWEWARLLNWVVCLPLACRSLRKAEVASILEQAVTLHTALTQKRIALLLQAQPQGQRLDLQLCLVQQPHSFPS